MRRGKKVRFRVEVGENCNVLTISSTGRRVDCSCRGFIFMEAEMSMREQDFLAQALEIPDTQS